MNTLLLLHFTAIGSGFILGLLVFLTNPKRRTNRVFFMLTILLTAWMTCQAIGLTLSDTAIVTCIRLCMIIAVFIPLAVDWLQTTIIHPDRSWRDIWMESRIWLLFSVVIATLSGTHLFVTGATRHGDRLLAEPLYTLYFPIYAVYFITSLGLMLLHFVRNLKEATGAAKTELQFVMLGNATGFAVGVMINVILPVMTNNSHYALLTPLSVICLYVATGYGIATRRIMDVATVMRRLTAYLFLIIFLAILYGAVWIAVNASLLFLGIHFPVLPHFLASLVVAFSLTPSRGWMKRVTNHLFISFSAFDASKVVQSADALFRSVSSVDRVLPEFTSLVTGTVGTDSAVIVLRQQGRYMQRYPEPDETPVVLALDDPLPVALATLEEAVVPDILRRLRLEEPLDAACRRIEDLKFAAAFGLFSQDGLEGLLLLPPRLSGRIYGEPEQQILQLLCNHLASAVSTSRLYTQLQDSKVYNEILVDSLVSGIVAAGTDGIINVFNREAQRITRLSPASTLGRPLDSLPPPLGRLLNATLDGGTEIINQDHVLALQDDDPIPLRVSSSVIFGHRGKRLGAFLVINDLTAIKQLELQVRRTDRLASLGTLAAGMAHEIKNPLVSIKTFTQLLPERFDDADFRETFTSLMSDEVKRIDSIVNQLLRFSRPSKPVLSALSLHELLTHTLKLLQQQMRPKNIQLVTALEANPDRINADRDQFSQVLINFILNAVESMKQGGTLTVATALVPSLPSQGTPHNGGMHHNPSIRITIQDTGEGITAENLPHIFDPFFTTKDQGTGLGLSVAHGIILEHSGSIDVASEPGRGATFTITVPLLEQEGLPS